MTDSILHYFHDPLCGWCYAATPMVTAINAVGIKIVMHGGGLWVPATQLAFGKSHYIRQSDKRISQLTGMPFGAPYLDGLLNDVEAVFWSKPPIAAVLAAGTLKEGADLTMLHAIQQAHYVDARRVVNTAVLTDLAKEIGLEHDAFLEVFNTDLVGEHIRDSRELMRRFGLTGFPGFVVERGAERSVVPHERFYGQPDEFVHNINAMIHPSNASE